MSTSSNLEKLIEETGRRLQYLKTQQARKGGDTEPHILSEIEDTEANLTRLKTELVEAHRQEAEATAPLIHLANFQPPPAALPKGAVVLDWSSHFQDNPRTFPDPAVWAAELLPELADLPARLGPPGLLRVEGSPALSTAFAFGQTFRHVGRYHLRLTQQTATGPIIWRSEAPPPAGSPPQFITYQAQGNVAGEEALVIIYAAPQTSLAGVVAEVSAFWGESDGLEPILTGGPYSPQQAKGVLVLEAASASQGRYLAEDEAVSLAHTSRRFLMEFIRQTKPARLHLFMAGPFGLAALLGHFWNAVGQPLHCYERLAQDHYIPSCVLR